MCCAVDPRRDHLENGIDTSIMLQPDRFRAVNNMKPFRKGGVVYRGYMDTVSSLLTRQQKARNFIRIVVPK